MKGLAFSLDALVAVVIFGILLVAVFSLSPLPSSRVAEANAVLIASDMISALEERKVLDTLDVAQIANNLSQHLPAHLNMSVTLRIYDDNLNLQETRQVNADLTGEYYRGKWLFIIGNVTDVKNFVIADYKVGFA